MHTTDRALNIDPRIEDPDKLKPLSRRGFIGRLVGGVAGATAFLSMSPKTYGAPAEEIFDMAGTVSDRPNVVVFFTDQQRWDTSGLHGNPMGLTPNFDAMARRGFRRRRRWTGGRSVR